MLNLYEEVFILALHEDKCSVLSSVEDSLPFALSAASLVELALQRKLRMDEKRRLELADTAQTGDTILDETLAQMQESERSRKISYWLEALAEKPKKLHAALVDRLVSKGVVAQEDKHLSWVIPSPFHPDQAASTKYALKTHLRTIVLASQETGQKELALLSILSGCRLLDVVFLKDELKMARRKIYEMLVGEALRNPDFQVVEEIQSSVESLCQED